MDGSPIDWTKYGLWPIVNTAIWVGVFAALLFVFIKRPQYKYKVSLFALVVVAMEILMLVATGISGNKQTERQNFYLSTKGELELSRNRENVLVFLADGFDGADFLGVFDEEPELKASFNGFTYFADLCGTSMYSEESVINVLTGNTFRVGLSFSKNVDEAYEKSMFFDALEKNNFETSIFVEDSKMVSKNVVKRIKNSVESRPKLNGIKEPFVKIYKMVMFSYVPHIFKKYFWYSSMEFAELQGGVRNSDGGVPFEWSNVALYNLVHGGGIKPTETDSKIYQFFWIQGPHAPANMDRYCNPLKKETAMETEDFKIMQSEQQIGVVRLFSAIVDELKRTGIFDNTTLVFLADHGWDVRPNPLLLIKEKGVQDKPLEISYAPVSMIEDWPSTFLYLITGQKSGKTVFDWNEGEVRRRKLFVYDINHADRTYNSVKTEFFAQGAFVHDKKFGDVYDAADLALFCKKGLSTFDYDHVWTDGTETVFEFETGVQQEDVLLAYRADTYADSQSVKIFSGKTLVADYQSKGANEQHFVVPASCIKNGILELRFEFSDAVSPASRGEGNDNRKLALCFYLMQLTSASKSIAFEPDLTFRPALRGDSWIKYFAAQSDLKKFDGSTVKTANENFQWNLDEVAFDSAGRGVIKIRGWIFCDGKNTDAQINTLVLKNKTSGEMFVLPTKPVIRGDVTSYFGGKTDYNNSGFFAIIAFDDESPYVNPSLFDYDVFCLVENDGEKTLVDLGRSLKETRQL